MNLQFWDGRRVLLTGHTGFKGCWLSIWLKKLGAEVAGFALAPSTCTSLFELADVADLLEMSVFADIGDLASLSGVVNDFRPEIVFHLAAQSLVRLSYLQPIETYRVNVLGTGNVLEAVRQSDCCRSVVVVTSDKCYENNEWIWGYRECDPLGGYDPYSSSKACAEILTAAYRRSFFESSMHGAAIATARAGNVIGGGDFSKDRLVPDVVAALSGGGKLKVRNPDSVRPWQHVLEPLYGYLLLAERLWADPKIYSQGWNFGPSHGDTRSVRWIAQQMSFLWGKQLRWEVDAQVAPHEAQLLTLDSSKARSMLGWHPRWTLEIALQAVVEWYQTHERGGEIRDLMHNQIATYASSLTSPRQEDLGAKVRPGPACAFESAAAARFRSPAR